jgi:hypothetical protein
MTIAKVSAVLILVTLCSNAAAQGSYGHLKAWDGQYPTYNKSPRKFFNIAEVRDPLRKLLPRPIYFLLTKGHTKEGPIKIDRNYLKAIVCGSPDSYSCDNITMLVIDLNDGSMYVAFDLHSRQPKYFATKGKFSDLPKDIQSEH